MREKNTTDIKPRKVSLLCISLLVIAVILTYTPLIEIYWINWLDILILSNAVNLIVIAVVLLILYRTEVKIIEKKIDDFNRKLGG